MNHKRQTFIKFSFDCLNISLHETVDCFPISCALSVTLLILWVVWVIWFGEEFFPPTSGDRFFPRHLTVKDFSPALYATRDNFFQCKINFYPDISLQDLFFPLELPGYPAAVFVVIKCRNNFLTICSSLMSWKESITAYKVTSTGFSKRESTKLGEVKSTAFNIYYRKGWL